MIEIPGYRIGAMLHEGSASLIYRARRQSDDLPVIIKTLKDRYPSPEALDRFKSEYDALKALKGSDGVIDVIDHIEHGHRPAIIMADIGGRSLRDILADQKPALADAIYMAIKAASAIADIHRRRWIHKDINPANIIWNQETGAVALIDFGIARPLDKTAAPQKPDKNPEGTLRYISPEQTGRIDRQIDWRSDLYAFGATFYEVLIGRPPFESENAIELVHAHIAKKPVPPAVRTPDIPEVLSRIIMKLLAKRTEHRYQSADGLKADLNTCLKQLKTQGAIETFKIGGSDIPGRIPEPAKRYGRDSELAALKDEFSRAQNGMGGVIVVSGPAGIGKTDLVQTFEKTLGPNPSFFASGHGDRFNPKPYAAISDAFAQLIRYLLTETDKTINKWKNRIYEAVGSNGGLITGLMPDLERLIGRQPPVSNLPPVESQNRFNRVFQQVFNVFAAPEHPLVVFLDNLQWLDRASLNLIRQLLPAMEKRYCLVVAAVRTAALEAEPAARQMLSDLRQAGVPVKTLRLGPLDQKMVDQWLAEVLDLQANRMQGLSRACFQKSRGSPLHLNQMLQTFHRQGMIWFDPMKRCWQWDIGRIESASLSESVAELVAEQIMALPQPTREVLKLGACIGDVFELTTLCHLTGTSVSNVKRELAPAISDGVIQAAHSGLEQTDPGAYRFVHERVAQAAYAMLPGKIAEKSHLALARFFKRGMAASKEQDRIFDAVHHYNRVRHLVSSPEERYSMAELNLEAGKRAKASSAYGSALDFFTDGKQLLGPDCWQERYELSFALFLEQAECEYITGNIDQAEKIFDILVHRAATNLEKAGIYEKKTALYANIGRYKTAIREGLKGLRVLGLDLPARPGRTRLFCEMFLVNRKYQRHQISSLAQKPAMEHPEQMMTMKIMLGLLDSAYFVNPPLMTLIALKMVRRSLKYGSSSASPLAFAAYSSILAGALKKYETAEAFAELAITVNRHKPDAANACRLYGIAAILVFHWRRPFQQVLDLLRKAYHLSLETGDHNFSGLIASWIIWTMTLNGKSLKDIRRQCETFAAYLKKIQNPNERIMHVTQGMINSLTGASASSMSFSTEAIDEAFIESIPNKTLGFWYYLLKLQTAYLLGYTDKAARFAEKCRENERGAFSLPQLVDYHFFNALRLTSEAGMYAGKPPLSNRRTLKRHLAALRSWAGNAPENHRHKYLLVLAEVKRLANAHHEAEGFYEEAISAAMENNFIHHAAIASELAGLCYAFQQKKRIARLYLTESIYLYRRWGASAKADRLIQAHAALLPENSETERLRYGPAVEDDMKTTSRQISGKTLDLESLMKATWTITSEIVLEALLKKMLRIVIENAGAQNGMLLMKKLGRWHIEAHGTVDDERIAVLDGIPVDLPDHKGTPRLPLTVLQYVVNTRNSIVLDNPRADSRFSRDPYFKWHPVQSMFCHPLIHKGRLICILYLENNLTAGAFSSKRVNVIRMLGGQFTISLENALLYENLRKAEEKVRKILDTANEGYLQIDTRGIIRDVNPELTNLTGKSRKDLIGTPLLKHFDKANAEVLIKQYRILEHQGRSTYEVLFAHPDGKKRHFLIKATAMQDEAGTLAGSFAMVTDITQRKAAEHEIRSLNEELEKRVAKRTLQLRQSLERLQNTQKQLIESEKMAALGDLVAGVAHEINTPVGVCVTAASHLQGQLQLLADASGKQAFNKAQLLRFIAKSTEATQTICYNLERAANLIASFKQVAVDQSSETPRQFNLRAYIEEVLVSLRPKYERTGHSVSVEGPEDLNIYGYPGRISQIITNLVINSVTHGFADMDTGKIALDISVSGDDILLVYMDNGRGMTPETRKHVFDPFFTTARKEGGTGLGMHIVYNLVTRSLGGEIECRSAPGKGVQFSIRMPKKIETPQPEAPVSTIRENR